ncbi:hypothetical protein LPJ56_002821 [Coemansia sp. RSA 2599]|nr:hypothetical protein LPJ75_002539 [Coemansia sp. RSA 2598]KAJ1824486.1 hypothetical protein LPJ56_002821 [Coemansia sp. RSA 2599]
MVTTLASICADAELSLHPSLQLLWDGWPSTADSMQAAKTAPPLSSRRSEMQSLKARRRKSSIAGSVLSSAVITGASPLASAQSPTTPKIGTQAFSDTRRPWRPAAAQGGLATLSSNVIVARYLPPAVARFCPPLARILDVQWEAEGYTLDEADEEQDMQGLAQYLGNPRALTRALSTHVQPIVERCARRSLQLWWRRTAERLQMSLARAVSQRIAQVADATRVSRALAAWEADMREDRQWARGFAWGAIAGNALAQDVALQSLHRSLVEPLLRVRASELQRAQVESALALADAFVESDADIHAGHLPWHALGDATPSSLSSSSAAAAGTALRELSADVRGSLVFLPTGVRELETRVFAGIEGAWVDAQAWWAQLSGATAAPEALACAQHFGQQWDLLVERLERWADACMAAKPADEALAARCIRGAWATVALASVSRQALAAADAQLVCACWQEAGVDEDRLVHRLHRVGQALLQPWQHVLGRRLASAWAQQFDALYYRVPGSLRADAVATRQDVVCAWRRVAPADAPWATRYAALRRLATAAACDGRAKAAPSQAVRRLVVALRAQVQAVGGLSAVSAGLLDGQLAMRRRIGAAAGAELAAAVQGKRAQAGGASEWDGRQIAADIRFVLHETLGVDDDTVAALVSECTQALACSAS